MVCGAGCRLQAPAGPAPTAPPARRGCCCCGCCCDCPKDFQKVLELKDVGLVVYRHTARTEERNKITGLLESATKTTEDVFILLNTKSSELTTAQYLPGIERTKISCPRCRVIAEQVRDMLQRAPDIQRRDVSGICNRCLMRDKTCHNCERILNKFMSNRREVSEGTKTLIRQWLSNIQHILDGITGVDVDEQRYGAPGFHSGRIRASSELYIDQALMRTRKDGRQLDIKPLFRPRAIKLDDRGQFVEDRSRFHGSDISMTSRQHAIEAARQHERERDLDGRPRRWQYDAPTTSRAGAAPPSLWTRRSFSEESIPSFAKASKGEAGRRVRDYGESYRFQEGEYKRRGEGRDFIEAADDIKSQHYRDHEEVSETYARGDAHYKDLKKVQSRSIGPTRKGTRVDTSADSKLAQRDDRLFDEFGYSKRSKGDDRKHDEIEARSKAKREDKDSYYRGKDDSNTPVEHTTDEKADRKKGQRSIEYGSKEGSKKGKEEQKHRDKDQTGRTKTDKSGLTPQDQQKLKSERDKSARDKSGQEQTQKGGKELTTKDKGVREQKQKGEKELSTKDKGGQEQKQKGEKGLSAKDKGEKEQKHKGEQELSSKDKGGQEYKQKRDKELSAKSKVGQEQKQKLEKELSTKDKGSQEQKLKGEKELGTKDKGRQEPKQKEKKELSTKDKTTQVPTLKGEKELSTKDKGSQEQKPKEERELGTKDKVGQETKQKGEKELSAKDKGDQEPKQKGEQELSTKDKGSQEQKPKEERELGTKDKVGQETKQKGEKELSTKDKDDQEPKQKGEKELSTKDKGSQEQKPKGEKELGTKENVGQEPKQKGEKELSTKDKGDQEPKQKGEKELSTKDKGNQEQKQKGEKELSTKDKGNQEQKQKGEKEMGPKDKGGEEPKQKGEKELGTKDKSGQSKQKSENAMSTKDKGGQEQKQKEKGQKGSDLKDKGAADTKNKGKVEKESDSKDKEAPDKKSKDEKAIDTKKKGKGDKDWDTRDSDDKVPKQDEKGRKDKEKNEKLDAISIILEQRKKDTKLKEEDKKTGKGRKTAQEVKKEEDNETLQSKKKESIVAERELAANKIRVRRPSPDDLILQLVKLKLATAPPRRPDIDNELKIINQILRDHFEHKHEKKQKFSEVCPFCADSDYGMDEAALLRPQEPEFAEVVIGHKVYKYKPPLSPRIQHPEQHQDKPPVVPIQFKSAYHAENIADILPQEERISPLPSPVPLEEKIDDSKQSKKMGKKSKPQEPEAIPAKGIINFRLSDRSFIEKGWTKLPTEKVVRKMNVYRMRPAHPEFNWFEHNKRKRLMTYESGERLVEFDDEGRGRWFYRNGRLALDYYDAEGLNAQQRFVIWSSGEADERGRARPYTILATFDYLGNGIVFDHTGKIRLKYNQTEGIVLDRSIGPVSHWKWHSLNDPPVLAQVMIETQESQADQRLVELGTDPAAGVQLAWDGHCADRPVRPDNDEMLAIEFDNFVRAKGEKLTQAFKPFQIKMKALKINEYFSLKVLDQATVYLIYRDGSTNLKLNLGMVLDHHEIVDTDNAEVGEVSSELERYPARTESLAALQRDVAAARRWERRRAAHDRRLHPPGPAVASADRLTAAVSRPSTTVPPSDAASCRCSRKPTGPTLYYDNRIF